MRQEEVWDGLYERNLTWKKETITLPKFLKGKRVLELGVGTGKTLISILKQEPSQVCAVDFSEKAIEKSKDKFGNKVKFVKADAKNLPFEQESFDVVVCYYVLNNAVKKDREKIVKEIYRVLDKIGACLFEDFSFRDFRNIGKKHKTDKNTIVKSNGLICHFFDDKEVRDLFEEFSKIEMKKYQFHPVKNKKDLKREIIDVIAKK